MTAEVREAEADDAAEISEVARESWCDAYAGVLDAETIDRTLEEWYAAAALEASIADARGRTDAAFLVAEDGPDRRIVGFAHADAWREDPSVAFLLRIYVRPARWGEGAGTALLRRLESALESEFDRLRLVVLADNEVGVSFYESRDFERVDRRESDLDEGVEEYVYERPI